MSNQKINGTIQSPAYLSPQYAEKLRRALIEQLKVLAASQGLDVTVKYYRAGTGKENKISS